MIRPGILTLILFFVFQTLLFAEAEVQNPVTGALRKVANVFVRDRESEPNNPLASRDDFYDKLAKEQAEFYKGKDKRKKEFIKEQRERRDKGEDTREMRQEFHREENEKFQAFLSKQREKIKEHQAEVLKGKN